MVPHLPSGRTKGKVETAKMRRLPQWGYPFFPYYLAPCPARKATFAPE